MFPGRGNGRWMNSVSAEELFYPLHPAIDAFALQLAWVLFIDSGAGEARQYLVAAAVVCTALKTYREFYEAPGGSISNPGPALCLHPGNGVGAGSACIRLPGAGRSRF